MRPCYTNLVASEVHDVGHFLGGGGAASGKDKAVGVPDLMIRRGGPDDAVVAISAWSRAGIGRPQLTSAVLSKGNRASLRFCGAGANADQRQRYWETGDYGVSLGNRIVGVLIESCLRIKFINKHKEIGAIPQHIGTAIQIRIQQRAL